MQPAGCRRARAPRRLSTHNPPGPPPTLQVSTSPAPPLGSRCSHKGAPTTADKGGRMGFLLQPGPAGAIGAYCSLVRVGKKRGMRNASYSPFGYRGNLAKRDHRPPNSSALATTPSPGRVLGLPTVMASREAAVRAVRTFRLHEIHGAKMALPRLGVDLTDAKQIDPELARRMNPQLLPNARALKPDVRQAQLQNPFLPNKHPVTGKWKGPKYSLRRQADLVKKAKAAGLLHLLPSGPKNPLPLEPKAVPAVQTKTPAASEAKADAPVEAADAAPTPTPAAAEAAPEEEAEPTPALPAREYRRRQRLALKDLSGEWTGDVHWVGEHRARDAPVARLYSGKRRMFKGKKHERVAHIVRGKRAVRMRDMAKRVREYKEFYRSRRPDPLAVPRNVKGKLPF
uniref:Large ribosomal subunit protein mL59 domain-containing protein n=1 Tax=Schizophyllum commune (strain H4-8 / FGSC 9210) TaxID=578458 RepID=D8QHP4_SCHCM